MQSALYTLLVALVVLAAAAPAEAQRKKKGTEPPPPAAAAQPAQPVPVPALGDVKSWGYQLKNVDIRALAVAPYDLIVTDYAGGKGKIAKPFTRAEIERLQRRPDGGRRLVIAYLSIGEAEFYRWYWNKTWEKEAARPPWLGEANDNWRDNHLVRYWYPEWKRLVYEGADSYLERILAAGFDGVYLDRADVAFHWRNDPAAKVDAIAEMTAFVAALSSRAKVRAAQLGRGAFYVIAQNAEELLDQPAYKQAVDGIAKEDLLYGIEGDEEPNAAREVAYSTNQLGLARTGGKAIFTVEYVRSPDLIEQIRSQVEPLGFVPTFAPRALEWLQPPPKPAPTGPPPAERRIGLVIANAAYANATPLTSPPADGRVLAERLRQIGFAEVVEFTNLGLAAMRAEIKAFGDRARAADWAVVIYAGHAFDTTALESSGTRSTPSSTTRPSPRIRPCRSATCSTRCASRARSASSCSTPIAIYGRLRSRRRRPRRPPCRRHRGNAGAAARHTFCARTGCRERRVCPQAHRDRQGSRSHRAAAARDGGDGGQARRRHDRCHGSVERLPGHAQRKAGDALELQISQLFRDVRRAVAEQGKSASPPHAYVSLSTEAFYLHPASPIPVAAADPTSATPAPAEPATRKGRRRSR